MDRFVKLVAHATIAGLIVTLLDSFVRVPGFRLILDPLRGWHVVPASLAFSTALHKSPTGVVLTILGSLLFAWPYHHEHDVLRVLLPIIIGLFAGSLFHVNQRTERSS
ncbi:MAG: hypothetical protein EDX89_08525 [Acidobacteria bacterium]|nr:MAG: hypothetical protein EDX89_08525 [Acidobacteriota bacterium]